MPRHATPARLTPRALVALTTLLTLALAQTPQSPSVAGPPPTTGGADASVAAASGIPSPSTPAAPPAQGEEATTLPDSYVYQKPKPPPAAGDCDASGPRKECGWYGIAAEQCASRGCCSSPPPTYQGDTRLWLPSCFHPNARAAGYRARLSGKRADSSPGAGNAVGGGRVVPDGDGALHASLELEGTGTSPELGPDVKALDFEATLLAPDVARVHITAPGRWALPASTLPGPGAVTRHAKDRKDNRDPLLTLSASASPFTVTVARSKFGCTGGRVDGGGNGPPTLGAPCSATPLFTTAGSRFIFKDQYLEFSTPIAPDSTLYGAGERTPAAGLAIPRDGLAITLWARDTAAADAGTNTYGAWPIVWEVRGDGSTHALVLLSSNGLEISATEGKLTWRVTGGGIDLVVASGPTPADAARQVASLIGFPALQPYWALGLMNSKYGLGSAAVSKTIVQSYAAAGIPLETFVSDSQYMDEDRIFTWGKDFDRPAMREFVTYLHDHGQRWIPIIDPVVAAHKGYRAYEDALSAGDIFIRDVTGAPYLGQMWPGACHWPDFLDNSATTGWWGGALKRMAADVGGLDGVWLDMNEVSNFCSGDVCSPPGGASPTDTEDAVAPANNFVCTMDCTWGVPAGAKKSKNLPPPGIFDPPFKLNNAGAQRNLSEKTLPVTASHPATGALEYDVHNLYGHYMSLVTVDALSDLNRGVRPFVFGRSTFLGTGRVAGHWTGDTSSGWRDLRRLIPAVLAAGLSGNPFTGGDVCGFMNLATPDLCAAWVAAAALHPLMRFHHAQGFQEPYRWPAVAEATRKAVAVRYKALPALYSAGALSAAGGCPIARPAWFAWPADGASRAASGAWTVGDSLLVVPLLAPVGAGDAPAVPAPAGAVLYDLWRRTRVTGGSPAVPPPPEVGGPTMLAIGGSVTPLSAGGNSTAAAREAPLTLVLAMPGGSGGANATAALKCGRPCAQGVPACGDVYLDRGDETAWGLGAGKGRVLAVDAADDYGVDLTWPSASDGVKGGSGGGGGKGGGCDKGIAWPRLERVVVLGAHPGAGAGGKVKVKASKGADAPKEGRAVMDAATGALEVTFPGGKGIELVCGAGVEVRWEVDRKAMGAAAAPAAPIAAPAAAPAAASAAAPAAAAGPV